VNIDILYEDKNYVAINKPAGLVVHADGRTKEKTVADWILEKYPEIKGVGEPLRLSDETIVDRPGIVHRIDRDTSKKLDLRGWRYR
jgi:23S rRNA pseudouridine1911/1915/1917 synthase